MKLLTRLLASISILMQFALAQDTTSTQQIDASKPTNLYTQLNIQGEYNANQSADLIGTRINLQYAFNKNNLLFAELPILYNATTKKAGISDVRVRYFDVVKRNITQKFIAIAPFVDITAPTGETSKGLGGGQWSLATGVVGGFATSQQFAFFPGVSYVYLTKSKTSGIGLQFNGSYSFSKKTFAFINPTPLFLLVGGKWKSVWQGNFSINQMMRNNKAKLSAEFSPDFTSQTYISRIGYTLFL